MSQILLEESFVLVVVNGLAVEFLGLVVVGKVDVMERMVVVCVVVSVLVVSLVRVVVPDMLVCVVAVVRVVVAVVDVRVDIVAVGVVVVFSGDEHSMLWVHITCTSPNS